MTTPSNPATEAPTPGAASELLPRIEHIVSALDSALGDTDPNYVDMTDEEVRDEDPMFWACQQLSALMMELRKAPPVQSVVTVCSRNEPAGPAWCAVADWDAERKCYVTRDPMYGHPAVATVTEGAQREAVALGDCPNCRGTGQVAALPSDDCSEVACHLCDGSGWITTPPPDRVQPREQETIDALAASQNAAASFSDSYAALVKRIWNLANEWRGEATAMRSPDGKTILTQCADELDNARANSPDRAQPERVEAGEFVLVPRTLTDDMRAAFSDATDPANFLFCEVWDAVLAAAPAPPPDASGGVTEDRIAAARQAWNETVQKSPGNIDEIRHAAWIAALEAADRARKPGYGWQPIETAPKTGISMLMFQTWKSGHPQVFIGHYANGWVNSESIHEEDLIDEHPTHWMPLPKHPDIGAVVPDTAQGAEK